LIKGESYKKNAKRPSLACPSALAFYSYFNNKNKKNAKRPSLREGDPKGQRGWGQAVGS
jgi:hypothetical protein